MRLWQVRLLCPLPDFANPSTSMQGDANAAAQFQEVQKAYETLRDPEKRRSVLCWHVHSTSLQQQTVPIG